MILHCDTKNRYYRLTYYEDHNHSLVIEGRHAEIPSFAADLQKKGFDVQIAQNGSQAVARLKEVSPSLVVINAATLAKHRLAHLPIHSRKRSQDFPSSLFLKVIMM